MVNLGKSDAGAVFIISIVAIAGLLGAILAALAQRSENELKTAQHSDIFSEQAEIKGVLAHVAICPDKVELNCSLGETLEVLDPKGKPLISKIGDKLIGKWNVKIECAEVKGKKEYWVLASRFSGQTKDPLTGKPIKWVPVEKFSSFCPVTGKESKVVLSNICYGTVSGKDPLPPSLGALCGKGCEFENKMCGDDSVEFPTCPNGLTATSNYSDRFGWGGIDISKTTVCERVEAAR